ncbi:hypothetical protein [Stigmatella aurantiaca]|uniref:Conserved uncharacterized protein n=1 Tax=Stigmatella aurantiaca (strain DW4/3-1) TaxID=378806 RepID=Q08TJ1_STIAD|nr:hypothetical protein [Stigmatella aurantiaca]ADO71981.1 conserved uncharacterized protein [Stigmatella aurantiaca DW4/3-1]EAU63802.1 hypothetical protein STIAU_6397 [Stigmatella aurantiaca DW4/3-1]
MKAQHVLAKAKAWAEQEGSRIPGFHGAFVAGSVARMAPDTELEPWRDLDVVMLTREPQMVKAERMELVHEGIILESSCLSAAPFHSAETILSTPEHADNIAAGIILADPTGELQQLHKQVAAEYSRKRWVKARLDFQRKDLSDRLEQAVKASQFSERFVHFHMAMVYLSGLLAIAHNRPLTLRRRLVITGELLEAEGKTQLHEDVLALIGCNHLTRETVERYVTEFDQAFGRAIQVKRITVPYDYKFRAHLRPYYVEGTLDMVREGRHREAIFWLFGFYYLAAMVLMSDAPAEEKPLFKERCDRFFNDLGLTPATDWGRRLEQVRAVADRLSEAADKALLNHPALVD